jgi:hypothetical protein
MIQVDFIHATGLKGYGTGYVQAMFEAVVKLMPSGNKLHDGND